MVFVGCQGRMGGALGGGVPVLPADIAGTWKAEGSPWRIELSPDGTVLSAVIAMGEVEIRPNETTNIEGQHGEPGIFSAGDCSVEYDPANRELMVTIEMERIYMDMGTILDGNSAYYFIGPVSADFTTWETIRFVYLDAGVFKVDPNATGDEPKLVRTGVLRQDPGEGGSALIFRKVEDEGW